MKTIFLILFILLNHLPLTAQVNEEWVRNIANSGTYDNARSLALDQSGNIYIAGTLYNPNKYVVAKYDSRGDLQWMTSTPTSQQNSLKSVAIDDNGNVYAAGLTMTVKYNSSGIFQWSRADTSEAMALYQDKIIVSGKKKTRMYDSLGNTIWIKPDTVFAYCISVSSSGNIYVAGDYSFSSNTNYVTIKYNQAGQKKWQRTYDGPIHGTDNANSIALDQNENVYVTGRCLKSSNNDYDFATVKYDSSGVEQWAWRYGLNLSDEAEKVIVDNAGFVYVSGSINSGSTNYSIIDFATVKYSPSGELLWEATYNGTGNHVDRIRDMAIDSDGNIYVTGFSVGPDHEDIATIKYDSSGTVKWVERYNGPANVNDESYAIIVDPIGNVYVAGEVVWQGGGNLDITLIKYSQAITGIYNSQFYPSEYSLSQNYPNPFNPNTIINYELGITNFVKLNIYDILGNEVATLVNEKKIPGSYSVEYSGENLSSGIYFYKLEVDGNIIDTKRMVLLK